jgi:DNA-binding LacI/PurR family transcriptional regulator
LPKSKDRPSARGPLKMRDIANLAGVSTATISRVLHNSTLVDADTAQRVRDVIRKNSYVPNATGTALKSGRSGIFGLIVPDITNPFFADFVKHFEREVVDHDQEMLLAITDHLPEEMQRSTRRMLMRGVEGIAILESEIETSSYETMLHNRVPIVTLNRLTIEPCVSDVAVHASSGMTAAVRHLQKFGHQRIGFLGGRPGQSISMEREKTFRAVMKKVKLPIDKASVVPAHFTIEGGYNAMNTLLEQPNRVTAVLCANDLSAIGAMNAMRYAGIVPGKDLSVIGLDDIDICTMIHPTLTTLRLSREHMVKLFLQALARLSQEPYQKGEQFMIELELIVRESTGPAPARSGVSKKK